MEKNSSTYEKFMERFPKLGLMAPSWTEGDCERETVASLNPGKADALYVYGMGRGAPYFQVQDWLLEDRERRLIFLEDDPSSLSALLSDKRAEEILSNLQVHIELISRTKEEIEQLSHRFPLKRIEVASIPSRKGPRFYALKLQLLRSTTLSYALHLDRLYGYQPLQNFVQNLIQLPRSFYAGRLKDAFRGIPAIVCGAGPSLNRAIPHLKKLDQRALLIAGGSTIAALSSKGVLPHFGMAIDPNLEEYRRFRNSFAFEMPLLYSTRVFPAIFQTCSGPFGYMRSGIGGVPEIWMEEELGLTDPLIGEHLSSESISVTTICTALAQFLGCNPILFCGVDLAYTGKKRYAEGVIQEEESSFALLDAEKSAADRIIKRKDRHGQPVYTAIRWIMESASLSHFAKKHPNIQFLNTTDGGIGIKGVPFLPLEEASLKFRHSTDLRTLVQEKIAAAPMPENTQQIIDLKMSELKDSLDRIVGYLEVLSGKRSGSKPLAEVELEDEMAMSYLFYDIDRLFERSDEKWERFLDLARKYQAVLSVFGNDPIFM